jgi:hypothetical protein
MTAQDLLTQCKALGVTLTWGEHGTLRVSPPGVLAENIREQLRIHKPDLRRLLTAPPADVRGDDPCATCGSHERWHWLDGRLLCRVCVVLDLMPMSLLSSVKEGA